MSPFSGSIDELRIGCIRPQNQPPVAQCRDLTLPAGPEVCSGPASIDDGSFDPDGDPITLVETPEPPYLLGSTDVTLTVTDPSGAVDRCTAVVTVADNTPPEISDLSVTPQVLWPPDHKMVPVVARASSSGVRSDTVLPHRLDRR